MDASLLKLKEVEAFLAAIRANPMDDHNRAVFADYLDELDDFPGKVRLVALYRGEARKWLEDFCAPYKDPVFWGRDEADKDDLDMWDENYPWFTPEYVVMEAKKCLENPNSDWDKNFRCRSNQSAQDKLAACRDEFWTVMEVMTGLTAPQEFRKRSYFSCGC